MSNQSTNNDAENLELQVGIEVINSYKRLSYTAWYAFAELVDNSTQSYIDNKELMDETLEKEKDNLTVKVEYDRGSNYVRVWDNSIGMSKGELARALQIGTPPVNNKQRSKYGLGLKTAACWFGNNWSVTTSKLGKKYGVRISVDVESLASTGTRKLPTEIFEEDENVHYTEVKIGSLNRQFHGKTLTKVKEFLSSMYRFDIEEGLFLTWQGDRLEWNSFRNRFYITQEGKPYIEKLAFEIGSPPKKIHGWVGVLSKGSRKDAGFSLIQNKRVIKGWPNAYKPTSVFGDQDLGVNDLVNQRVVGELFVDGFAVSHTKDNILWQDDEEEMLEGTLGVLCQGARTVAKTIRVRNLNNEKAEETRDEALDILVSELKSDEIRDKLFNETIPDTKVIQASYRRLIDSSQKSDTASIDISIGSENDSVKVKVYFRSASEFEPYVLAETSVEKNTVLIIINTLHPYWVELKNLDGFLSFVRHCVYDGISEWKASKKLGAINADTVKYIKDLLLRLPFEITNNRINDIDSTDA
ncbi:ATP-binding protein [Marinoscillum sp.]|uniref:ATP-binding protein n=1 Tax=Marinoscillum sp. TaxID=2024838 RepID=UPI003BAB6441